MILVLDNYDSFTYNLVQAFGALGEAVQVHRNDALSVADLERSGADAVVVSPGPGKPVDAGVCVEAISAMRLPILGVCLGHQAIAVAFGGQVVRAPEVVHGKTARVEHSGDDLFQDLPVPFDAARYHSLTVDPETLPATLAVTATSDDGLIMGIRHRTRPIYGVQFHPESIATVCGSRLLENFVGIARACVDETSVRSQP